MEQIKTLGGLIKEARKERDWSLGVLTFQVSTRIGRYVPIESIRLLEENQYKRPNKLLVFAVTDVLGLDWDEVCVLGDWHRPAVENPFEWLKEREGQLITPYKEDFLLLN